MLLVYFLKLNLGSNVNLLSLDLSAADFSLGGDLVAGGRGWSEVGGFGGRDGGGRKFFGPRNVSFDVPALPSPLGVLVLGTLMLALVGAGSLILSVATSDLFDVSLGVFSWFSWVLGG